MIKRLLYLVIFLAGGWAEAPCQSRLPDLSAVDAHARSVGVDMDLYQLVSELTSPYRDNLSRVRSIFVWITDHIAYDWKAFNKEEELKIPECRSGQDCDALLAAWEKKYLNNILRRRKALCDGYARLFTRMCDIAGIEAATINGYTKTKPHQIGQAGRIDHAWNAVWLDTSWHLLDATWAAGTCTEDENSDKLNGFVKKFNDYYFLTPSEEFSRNHFPQYTRWVLKPGFTKEQFAANPYYDPAVLSKIRLHAPQSGIITGQMGDTIRFRFEYNGRIEKLQVNSNIFRNPDVWTTEQVSRRKKIWVKDSFALKRQRYVPFRQKENCYEFDYIIPENSLYYLDILFDYRRVLRFKVAIRK